MRLPLSGSSPPCAGPPRVRRGRRQLVVRRLRPTRRRARRPGEGARRRKIRIGGQLRDFDELRTLKAAELQIGQAGEKDYKNLRWRYKKDGDVEFVEDDDNLADDDIVFGGSKSDIRRIQDLERNMSELCIRDRTTDGAATDSDDDDFATVTNKKTRFKNEVRFSHTVSFDDNILVLNKDVSGNPSENAGIEIRRGNQTNAKLLWNQTSDHWEIASGGTTGRILTTGDNVITTSNMNSITDIGIQQYDIQLGTGADLQFEGSTNNNKDTTLTVIDPTSNRTISLPDATGTVALTSDIPSLSGYLQNVSEDTSPQLGGNLDVNGKDIVSTSNGDIEVKPNGSGDIHLETQTGMLRINRASGGTGVNLGSHYMFV